MGVRGNSVLESDPLKKPPEQRGFPRIAVQCPVRYRENPAQRWQIGRLVNYSATGLLMTTRQAMVVGDNLTIQIERGSQRDIPPLAGEGTVVRCSEAGPDQYEVAIKILRYTPRTD